MKKIKLYLDTSVISHLLADDAPDKMTDTQTMWQQLQYDRYEVFLSEITMRELNACSEPKRSRMLEHLATVAFNIIPITPDIEEFAEQVVSMGILKPKHYDDCLHIAAAVIQACDYIVSWNFKHMVNVRTINGVRAIINLSGYHLIDIVSPTMLIGDDDND